MLVGDQLSFRYSLRHPWILRDFDLAIAPGETVGLMGPSGFGKTTLGKLLAGYLTPTQGSVMVNNQPLPLQGYAPVQLIFQNPELTVNPRWRVRQILQEGHLPTSALLDALGVHKNWFDRYPHELSGGELQRIAVARVLNPATRYLIADEMTAMLDANTQALIWQAVLNYTHTHTVGLLVISHEFALLKRLCHRIIDLTQKPFVEVSSALLNQPAEKIQIHSMRYPDLLEPPGILERTQSITVVYHCKQNSEHGNISQN